MCSRLLAGLILVLFGLPLLIDHAGAKAVIRAFPRSASAGYVVFGAAEMVLTGYVIGTLRRRTPDAFMRDEEQMLALLLNGLSAGS